MTVRTLTIASHTRSYPTKKPSEKFAKKTVELFVYLRTAKMPAALVAVLMERLSRAGCGGLV